MQQKVKFLEPEFTFEWFNLLQIKYLAKIAEFYSAIYAQQREPDNFAELRKVKNHVLRAF